MSTGGKKPTVKVELDGEIVELEADVEIDPDDLTSEDIINQVITSRHRPANVSYFAFTATPKAKTMELFGRKGPDGLPEPFHVYSMRQAIEEGFILDVLKHYISYKRFYKLGSVADEKLVPQMKAKKVLARFANLHPYNISQKVVVVVEHFREYVAGKIGGKAKAMVVTDGRKAAVRYKLAMDKYLKDRGYHDMKALVAFSGKVADPESGPDEFSESGMNPEIKGQDPAEAFKADEYRVLLVASKYQTGFDQPLLYAMYVDKRLSGVMAVQTLSRVNRTYDGKDGTFILDFVNKPEEILESFQPYYRGAQLEDTTDPNIVHDLQTKLDKAGVYFPSEVEAFAKDFFDPKRKQAVLHSQLLGEKGIALISKLVLEMGYIWRATVAFDAGIDGEIEIRDPHTQQVTNRIIKVQSKAVSKFRDETPDGFDYWPSDDDVKYWLGGNVPVILILSCPAKGDAYWVAVKQYKDSAGAKTKKIHFDKNKDRLDSAAAGRLASLVADSNAGVYTQPAGKQERLISNLLPVTTLPQTLFIADTTFREGKKLLESLLEKSKEFGSEWFLKNKQLYSFRDLREFPYCEVCDVGTVEDFSVSEWADSDDPERQRDFVRLLNNTLRAKLRSFGVVYEGRAPTACYYFRGNRDFRTIRFRYFAVAKETSREVFRAYNKKNKALRYCRHSAFRGQFFRFEQRWYLEITPTYYFTSDGLELFKFYEDPLMGIKRLENNGAVRGQFVMWAALLTKTRDLHRPDYPYLSFGEPQEFMVDAGFEDSEWLARDTQHSSLADGQAQLMFELL